MRKADQLFKLLNICLYSLTTVRNQGKIQLAFYKQIIFPPGYKFKLLFPAFVQLSVAKDRNVKWTEVCYVQDWPAEQCLHNFPFPLFICCLDVDNQAEDSKALRLVDLQMERTWVLSH